MTVAFGSRVCPSLSLSLSLSARSIVGHDVESPLCFTDISSSLALLNAWMLFRRGKRSRADVMRYERYLEANLFRLEDDLNKDGYRHGGYQPFTVFDPKQRRIHKATVRDRLVHQALVTAIEPLFERHFIHDSFSCRKGKGVHAAVQRLQTFLRRASHNNTQTVYALKCDVKQFFASVDHGLLCELLAIRVGDPQIKGLLDEVINSFSVQPGKGIPLGNLTSQLFANVYLHELDWFVKQNLSAHHYIRYCDDFIIISTDRQYLISLIPQLARFLDQSLGLTLHPNKIHLRSWQQGIDFLGYVLKPKCILLRGITQKRMLKRASEDNLSSYMGLCTHANCYELEQLLITIAN